MIQHEVPEKRAPPSISKRENTLDVRSDTIKLNRQTRFSIDFVNLDRYVVEFLKIP